MDQSSSDEGVIAIDERLITLDAFHGGCRKLNNPLKDFSPMLLSLLENEIGNKKVKLVA